MANPYSLVGKKILYIGSERIDSQFLASESATVTITAASTEYDSMEGTFSIPNGSFEEIAATFTVLVPSIRFLRKIFPNLWEQANYTVDGETVSETTDPDDIAGRLVFGAGTCRTVDPIPVCITNVCADGSEDDIFIPQAIISQGGEFTVSRDDPFEIEITIGILPSTEGMIYMGVGDLEKPARYDPENQSYVAVTSGGESDES